MSEMDYKGFIEREIRKEVKRWCLDNMIGWFDYEICMLVPGRVRAYRITYTVVVRFSGDQISIDEQTGVVAREEVAEYKRLHVTWVASRIIVREVTEE